MYSRLSIKLIRLKKSIKNISRKKLLLLLGLVLLILLIYSFLSNLFKARELVVFRERIGDPHQNIYNKNTIYFLEVSNSTIPRLSARQACAIESAAYMNPKREVVLLILVQNLSNYALVEGFQEFQQLFSYKNIHFRYFYLEDIVRETPIAEWIKRGEFDTSKHKTIHLSDLLRYALLYKYSGLYLDLDMITLHPVDEIQHKNFVCVEEIRDKFKSVNDVCFEDIKENFQSVNNAVIKITDNFGRDFANMLLEAIPGEFNPLHKWVIGPRLLTKTIKKFCNIKDFKESIACKNFEIFPIEKCYAVEGCQSYIFYEEKHLDRFMELTKNSYFSHLWSGQPLWPKKKFAKTRRIGLNVMASKYCPLVYENNYRM